jgi:hypothetical protein
MRVVGLIFKLILLVFANFSVSAFASMVGYQGDYICQQGRTSLNLIIRDDFQFGFFILKQKMELPGDFQLMASYPRKKERFH